MRLKSIFGHNLKGSSFEHELSVLNIITGRNETGKSTRADAIMLTLAGFHPGYGKPMKTNQDIMAFASGDNMTVSGGFDGGQKVSRQWKRGRGGAVSYEEKITGLPEGWTAPAVMFDIGSYLNLSDAARVDYVFGLCQDSKSELKPETLAAKFKNIKLEPHSEEAEAVINELVDLVYDDEGFGRIGNPIPARLATLDAALTDRLKVARQTEKRMNLTAQGIEQLRAEAQIPVDSGADRKLDEARRKHETLIAARAKIEADGLAAKKAEDDAEATAAGYVAPEPGAKERLESKAAELRKALEEAAPVLPQPGQRPSSEEARLALEGAKELAGGVLRDVTAARAEVARLESAIKAAEHAKTCPTCKQSIEEIQKQVVVGYQKPLKAAKAALTKAEAAIAGSSAAQAIAQANFNAAEKVVEEYNIKQESNLKEYSSKHSKRQESENLIRVTERQLQALKDADAKAEPARLAREQVPALKGRVEIHRGEWTAADAAITAHRSVLDGLEQQQRQFVASRAAVAQKAEALKSVLRTKADVDATKAAADIVAEEQAKLVETAFGAIIATANRIAGGILTSPLEYRDGRIGRTRDGRFYDQRTFSGSGRALTCAALSVALAAGSEMKLVILDEADIDESNRAKVFRMLEDVTASGELNQAFVIGTQTINRGTMEERGWNVIAIGS